MGLGIVAISLLICCAIAIVLLLPIDHSQVKKHYRCQSAKVNGRIEETRESTSMR